MTEKQKLRQFYRDCGMAVRLGDPRLKVQDGEYTIRINKSTLNGLSEFFKPVTPGKDFPLESYRIVTIDL
jgi:hypothetical protein